MDKNNCVALIAIVLALGAVGLSCYTLYVQRNDVEEKLTKIEPTEERLQALKTRVHVLTSKTNNESQITGNAMSLLTNETTQLREDYVKLLKETIDLSKTINYTTSSTVQRVLEELINVKEIQKVIQTKLEALSHLNDTAEDYLNLREEVKNLTTEVSENITRVEKNVEDNRKKWQQILENQQKFNKDASLTRSDISSLQERLTKLEKNQKIVNEARRVDFMLYTVISIATLCITHV